MDSKEFYVKVFSLISLDVISWLPICISLLIGYRPFVEACIEADEKGEALKYIPKLADPRERAEVIKLVQHIICSSDSAACPDSVLSFFCWINFLLLNMPNRLVKKRNLRI